MHRIINSSTITTYYYLPHPLITLPSPIHYTTLPTHYITHTHLINILDLQQGSTTHHSTQCQFSLLQQSFTVYLPLFRNNDNNNKNVNNNSNNYNKDDNMTTEKLSHE